jgi:hypothetical protein
VIQPPILTVEVDTPAGRVRLGANGPDGLRVTTHDDGLLAVEEHPSGALRALFPRGEWSAVVVTEVGPTEIPAESLIPPARVSQAPEAPLPAPEEIEPFEVEVGGPYLLLDDPQTEDGVPSFLGMPKPDRVQVLSGPDADGDFYVVALGPSEGVRQYVSPECLA